MLKKIPYLFIFLTSYAYSQPDKEKWVDSIFYSLNQNQRIAQLLMISVSPYASEKEKRAVENQIKHHQPGFLCVTGGGPRGIANQLTNLQRVNPIPMLSAIRFTNNMATVVDSLLDFPPPLFLGAVSDDSIIYQWSRYMGRTMKAMGIRMHIGLQLSLPKFSTPYEECINLFGNSSRKNAQLARFIIQGMKDEGIVVCATHEGEKMKITPTNNTSIMKVDVDTYQGSLNCGVQAIMTSDLFLWSKSPKKHSYVPPPQWTFHVNFTYSEQAFNGLTLWDASRFQVSKRETPDAAVFGFRLGNDIIMVDNRISKTIKRIKRMVKKNPEAKTRLDQSVRKILTYKYEAGLFHIPTQMSLPNIREDEYGVKLANQLTQAGITTIKKGTEMPIQDLHGRNFYLITVGGEGHVFSQQLSKYTHFTTSKLNFLSDTTTLSWTKTLQHNDIVIVALFLSDPTLISSLAPYLKTLSLKSNVLFVNFGHPDVLIPFEQESTLIACYTNRDQVQSAAAQAIMGAIPTSGRLSYTSSLTLSADQGQTTHSMQRLAYNVPETVGMKSSALQKITNIIHEAIQMRATPGCQLMIARKGTVVYDQCFGYLTYQCQKPVTPNVVYDLASITKVAATLPAIMYLYERGAIDMYKKASMYLPDLRGTNKEDIRLIDVLTHQSGMIPYIPYWEKTMEDNQWLLEYYRPQPDTNFSIRVVDGLYTRKDMRERMWNTMLQSQLIFAPPHQAHQYQYSDLSFYVLHQLAETQLQQPLDKFVKQLIYDPIGATTLGYQPLRKFAPDRIAPTEYDTLFRKTMIHGYVHDQGAALMGGIAGHAGLFGSASDLIKLGQFWLQKGKYGNALVFQPSTFDLFTDKHFYNSRRALGWDKPLLNDPNSLTCEAASPATFGHTGFTGTAIWVDPIYDLVFVFLSNRIHPSASNSALKDARIRQRVHQVAYEAIFAYDADQK